MKRLAFYTFWEKNGIVRKYVLTYLKGLQEVADRIIVIANGNLSKEGKETLERLGVDVLQRENRGIDFGAWKAAFDHLGWNEVRRFDELILTNCSCYGPVYPFSESFQKMAGNPCDFWGLTRQVEIKKSQLQPDKPDSYIRAHIQSFFIVLRRPVIESEGFEKYWKDLHYYDKFLEEVYWHETQFTAYLESLGFSWDTVFKPEGIMNPSYYQAYDYINCRYPLVKRKLFSSSPEVWTEVTGGEIPRLVMEKLEKLGYPVSEIYEDLLGTTQLSVLNSNIHFNQVILDDRSENIDKVLESKKIAAIFFAYYEDSVDKYIPYIRNLPSKTHICLISTSNETLEAYRKAFSHYDLDIEYRIKINKGRDFAAYCIAARDIFDQYDYICCVKDKKSPQLMQIVGDSFDRLCWNGVLFSKDYVNNCISLLSREQSLGLIFSPPPNFGPFTTIGDEIGPNLSAFEKLWEKLGINVPVEKGQVVAPFGSVFWIKKEASRTILSRSWTYDEMPKEPLAPDGTLLHGIERIWAYAAQNDGYYPLIAIPSSLSDVYYGNTFLRLRDLNACLFKRYDPHSHQSMLKIVGPSDDQKNINQISVLKLIKYCFFAKFLSGKRKEHYRKKLQVYLKKFM